MPLTILITHERSNLAWRYYTWTCRAPLTLSPHPIEENKLRRFVVSVSGLVHEQTIWQAMPCSVLVIDTPDGDRSKRTKEGGRGGGGGEVTEGGGVKGAVNFSCTATDSSDLPAARRLSQSMKPFSREASNSHRADRRQNVRKILWQEKDILTFPSWNAQTCQHLAIKASPVTLQVSTDGWKISNALSTNKYIQKVQYPPRYTWTSAQPTHRKTAVRNNCSDGKSNYWIPLKFVHPSRLSQGKINFYASASNLRHIKDAGFTTMHRQHSELSESEGGVWGWNADCVTTSK